jgi:hypothetical protein
VVPLDNDPNPGIDDHRFSRFCALDASSAGEDVEGDGGDELSSLGDRVVLREFVDEPVELGVLYMYSPSTYTALDTNVDRRLRRRVYLFSSRISSSFCWIRSMRLGPPMLDVAC